MSGSTVVNVVKEKSLDSTESGDDLVVNDDRKVVEQKIKMRRRAVIFSIVTIFSVTTMVLLISVLHEELNFHNVGYEDVICQKGDAECFKLICPQGWWWVQEEEECKIMEGYECCKYAQHLCGQPTWVRCYNTTRMVEDIPDCSCTIPHVDTAGVVTSGYKQICHQDFVWVEWRKRCIRRN